MIEIEIRVELTSYAWDWTQMTQIKINGVKFGKSFRAAGKSQEEIDAIVDRRVTAYNKLKLGQ